MLAWLSRNIVCNFFLALHSQCTYHKLMVVAPMSRPELSVGVYISSLVWDYEDSSFLA